MNVTEAVQKRRTVRQFLPDPVPEPVIREIVDIARQAPSNSNTQPWHISVVSGAARDRLQQNIMTKLQEGMEPHPYWPPGGVGLEGAYKERQYACAWEYYGTMGVARDDKEGRQNLLLRNWNFLMPLMRCFCQCQTQCTVPMRWILALCCKP